MEQLQFLVMVRRADAFTKVSSHSLTLCVSISVYRLDSSLSVDAGVEVETAVRAEFVERFLYVYADLCGGDTM
ncbi:hypothetical protein ACLKA6_009106 [Drosophila palustris]